MREDIKQFKDLNLTEAIAKLADVKVGDTIAPLIRYMGQKGHYWGGALRSVTRVGGKRFMVLGDWVDKTTGERVSRFARDTVYVIATPSMIAAYEVDKAATEKRQQEKEEYDARPDVIAARTILFASVRELIAAASPGDLLTIAHALTSRERERKNVKELSHT